jgi:hypothetical protein
MQVKILSLFAAALTVQSAYAISSTQQGQALQQSEQSEQSKQIHQLQQIAQDFQTKQATEAGILDFGLPTLNATGITSTLNSVANVFATTGNAISNITSATLAQQLPVCYSCNK